MPGKRPAHPRNSGGRPLRRTTPSGDAPPPEPDLRAAEDLVLRMMAIPGRSGQERGVMEHIVGQLRQAGAARGSLRFDQTHRRIPSGGEIGNLILRLPGTVRGPRRLLMAHVDTVPLCVGSRPVRRGRLVVPADKSTALGADDRSGAAVVLTAALEILRRGLDHPPLVFLWTVQEELGLLGARYARLSDLGGPRLAFNFDGGSSDKVTVGATGGQRLSIRVRGIASHAGGAPEQGVSAIAIAALAVASLQRDGWHGLVEKDGRRGTSNVGVIHGGEATNVVAPEVEIRAEARSHDPAFRRRIVAAIREAFTAAADSVRNVKDRRGRVEFHQRNDYEAFQLAPDEPCVLAAEAAIRSAGGDPVRAVSNGGLDANWMSARGLPTVTLGSGQRNPHTCAECLELAEFRQACRVALRLATGKEGSGVR